MNRILQYLHQRECQCCSELRQVERQLDAAAVEAERIEHLAGDLFEFWLPTAARVLNPKPDDDLDGPGIRLLIGAEARVATIDENLTQYAVDELRRIGAALMDAADAIEGVSP